jgi:acyl-CoA oxidase
LIPHPDPDLVALFADPLLARGLGPGDDLPYRALRRLTGELSGGKPLLSDQQRLRTLLELCAVEDPRLFHVMFLHHCMTTGAALDYGATEEDVAELAAARSIGAALMTEAGHGNSSAGILTEAGYDPASREFVLHTPSAEAVKYPPNVAQEGLSRLTVVSARLSVAGEDRGTWLFLVPLRDPAGVAAGVTIERRPPTALLPLDYASVRFDHVRVPYHRWLADGAAIDADGTFHDPLDGPQARTRRSLSMSRFAWGAVIAGLSAAARAAVAIALRHAERRLTVDRLAGEVPALVHLNQQRLLFGALAEALAATVLAHRVTGACWYIPPDGGRGSGPSATAMRALSLAKATTDRLADHAVSRCREAAGAAGFFSENQLIGYQALTTAFHSAGGDNRLILLDAAWTMATGTDYQPPEDTPSAPDVDLPDFDPQHRVRLLRARERLLHQELTAHLRAAEEQGADRFTAWNSRTDLAQELAEAHTARTTAETLLAQWQPQTGPDAVLLRDLYRIRCLEEVAAHADWYLTEGLLTAAEVRALPVQLNEAVGRLAPRAGDLVELLRIPAALLHGPLAGDDYCRDLAAAPAGSPGIGDCGTA